MQTTRILTLTERGLSITINQLTLDQQHYYFWFTGEFSEETPKRGKGSLFPCFEDLWNSFDFDPFQLFPKGSIKLPVKVEDYLSSIFQSKKKDGKLNGMLTEQWEGILGQIPAEQLNLG